jgi:hypothetical protein
MSRVSIIMYHYVRDYGSTKYPEIKGLDVRQFVNQINYLQKQYNIITMEDVISHVYDGFALPSKAALLTFDDGYYDHFQYVFPVLIEKSIQGSFFPTAKAVLEKSVLDVNKIHLILASNTPKEVIFNKLLASLKEYRGEYRLKDDEYYLKR